MSRTPLLSRRGAVVGVAAGLFAAVFGIRAAEVVDVEAADSLLAAPIALVAMAFGVSGGIVAGLVAAAAFAAGEAMDSAKLTWDEVAVRAVGFTALGSFVGVAATALRRSRAQFAAAFDNAPTAILLTDTGGVIAAANAAAERLLGRAKTDLVGTPLATLSDPFDSDVDDVEWESLRAGEILNYTTERRLVSATGGGVPVLMALSRMTSRHDGTEVIVHLVDLSAQRRSEEQLAHLADHDPLTGLFNRRRFDLELRQHLLRVARHGPVGAVLLLDLDHFKYVNDTLGHAVGDIVLRGVADALAERVRAADVLARLGGDEFAILLPDASSRADVETAAADVLAIVSGISIALPDTHAGPVEDVHVTASIGAALVPPFADPDRLLTAADLAMYEAKEAGRSQAKIHSTQSAHAERIRAGFTWGERIRQALVDRRFELHLQPIVPLSGREAHQYEALLRLSDGGRLWYPAEFLRHGERLGLMGDIDRYVVERAAQLLAELPPQLRPRLEVNLSAASLGDEKLSEWIDQLLHRYDVSPTSMIFEITETVAIANMALAGTTIRQLQERGCGFALDDFGVGVSSFYYLRELPFDILKIDGEFVRDLATNRANQLIVRSMIDAARGLGKITVAEFVESLEIAEILRQLGCDYAQGHFFGKARPAAEVLPAR